MNTPDPYSTLQPRGCVGLTQVGISRDGHLVYDRPASHSHVGPDLLGRIVNKVTLANRPFARELITFNHEIGRSTCVSTSPADEIVYARRPRRWGPSRVVLNRKPEPSSSAVVILKRMEDRPECYLLVTAFVGSMPEPEPWDKNATADSRNFWAGHALIWNSTAVELDTLTLHCPWRN